ncbi:DnaJ domain-containing protein [Wolbachia endosymbiont of Frankliniella intonsa]|nr:DnaJ domain-containing protein [Wolbachia endosymbiont of Frankliniella intonsa]WGJ62155.1 DnaJ domain-containing protein [Wolbachia endosymbiont of Frankliniella intonsa]
MDGKILNENEYQTFKQLFLIFNIQKQDVVNSDIENIKKKFKKQHRELSLKYHPDKNPDNKESEEQFKVIAQNKPFLKNLQ